MTGPTFDPTPIILGAFGLAGTSIGALAWGFRKLLTEIRPALDKSTLAIESNTKITKSADKYLQQRNGRDAEIHGEMVKELKKLPEQMRAIAANNIAEYIKALTDSKLQVKEQHVDKLVVGKKVEATK